MINPEDGKELPGGIPIPPRTQEEEQEKIVRPPSHDIGVGGILKMLYRNIIINLTRGEFFSLPVVNKLMNDYLDAQAVGNPNFNRSNDRNNLMKTINARAITWKSFCKLMIFAKFSDMTITVNATREDGAKASAYVYVAFKSPMNGLSEEKIEDADL